LSGERRVDTGQAIGATDRLGGHAARRPVYRGEIFSTLYHNLGIDPATTTIIDPTGRPQHLADRPVMHEWCRYLQKVDGKKA
jgi:hypothetical protein